MAKWALIDGFNLAFRSFYAVPDLTRKDGFPTNAIHGWVRTLWWLEKEAQPDKRVAFFDLGVDRRREALLPEYKANRRETPEPLKKQIPYLKSLAVAMGFGCVEREGVEADDLIGAISHQLAEAGEEVLIVSADKDLAQCVGPGIVQWLPPPTANPRLGWRSLDEAGVKEKFGVFPKQIPDYLAFVGDTSDNIPGLPGVGPKTASKWLASYGSLEKVIANCGKIKPQRFQLMIHKNAENLRRNLLMTTLKLDQPPEPLDISAPDPEKLCILLEEMEMKTALRDARKRYGLER